MTDPEVYTVRSADGRRVFFEGPEKDARIYVENNFPRVHVEPGSNFGPEGPQPDVYVQSPNGDKAAFIGGEWPADSEPAPVEPVTEQEPVEPVSEPVE